MCNDNREYGVIMVMIMMTILIAMIIIIVESRFLL